MYRVGICGHLGGGKLYLDGQTVKTKMITKELKDAIGSQSVHSIDTHGWKKNSIKLLINCFLLIKKCENIIILPAHNGVKIFIPLFSLLNKIFHRKLHYIVIGGWLPEVLEKNKKLKNVLSKFDGIYVETQVMVKSLSKLGLDNVKYLPNFKRLDILKNNELVYSIEEPYKLCTFSRVMKEKGIEDAIKVVETINQNLGRKVYSLDIYGQIDKDYQKKFKSLKDDFPEYISYKGIVDFNNSVKVLKDYFILLFPTYYEGEGFAGTIIDAFSAGIPIIATNWRYNDEIIQDKHDGLLYDYKDRNKLKEILFDIHRNPQIIIDMKVNCLEKAKQFSPEIVIGDFIKYL